MEKWGWFRRHRRGVVAAVLGFVLALSLGAVAAWLINVDNAPGTAEIGELVAPTVSAGTLAQGKKCFPGETCDGSFNINNPNGALVITEVTMPGFDGVVVVECQAYLLANPHSGLSIPVPSGVTDNVVVPDAFTLDSDTPNQCQGEVLTRNVKLTFSTT
jgi:hypothetical protein